MSKRKTKFLERLCGAFSEIDQILVNRSEVHDISKIKQLEEKMKQCNHFGLDNFDKTILGVNKLSSNKTRNSKRY